MSTYRIDLSGNWTAQADGLKKTLNHDIPESIMNPFPISIPGDITSALITQGTIKHPYHGINELDTLWIAAADWVLHTTFKIPPQGKTAADQERAVPTVIIEMDRVDTVFTLEVNGQPAGSGSNMFHPHRFDITRSCQIGENSISMTLHAPEIAAEELNNEVRHPYPYSAYPYSSPGRNLLRKTQCQGGWDWGPNCMTSGIYERPILYIDPSYMLDYVQTHPLLSDPATETWDLLVRIGVTTIDTTKDHSITCSFLDKEIDIPVPRTGGEHHLTAHFTTVNPDLWWPAGYGEQPLYTVRITTDTAELTRSFGFRTLEMQSETDAHGKSLECRVNGRTIFCKGSNWIPSDALPAQQSEEIIESLLGSAQAAHMNMIRVWGGGLYETDHFYDTCDALGLLVWQDMMFSCSTYPAEDWFLRSVTREATYQIRRLAGRTCIALFCGNNECLGALTWYEESRKSRDVYLIDYDRLYQGTIAPIARNEAAGTLWWPSSPSAGPDDYSDCWHDDSKGDMHYWSVWHEGRPFESYREITPRFCSEFGFQSFPSYDLLARFIDADQLSVNSPAMNHHQRNERGNTIIVETMMRYFRFPSSFSDFIYISQVQQAWAMKIAVEYWRAHRPICTGALYWQLNDVWPCASWSSLEYGGTWKLLHFEARRFFAPDILSCWYDTAHPDRIQVSVVHDGTARLNGEMTITWYGFHTTTGSEPEHSQRMEITVPPDSASKIMEVLIPPGIEPTKHFAHLIFATDPDTTQPKNGTTSTPNRPLCENTLLLREPRSCTLAPSDITITAMPAAYDTRGCISSLSLTLSTDMPAWYVSLTSSIPGKFSDLGFHMTDPDTEKTISFVPAEPIPLSSLEVLSFKVNHLGAL